MSITHRCLPLACAVFVVGCQGRTAGEQPTTPTLNRACLVAASADAHGDSAIVELQRRLSQPRPAPATATTTTTAAAAAAAEDLAHRFIARARLTHDAGEYTVAGQAATCLDSLRPRDPTGELIRGHLLHQQHRFREAEAAARHLVTTREYALDYALLGDALMEQGRLAEAAEAYQKMIDLKPFYQSYTRAAHLRWLKGNLSGAIALTRLAIGAASPDDPESMAWAHTRLGLYELQRGSFSEALNALDAAVQYVPEYPAALLGRGRVLLAQGKRQDAVAPLRRAAELNPLPEYLWTLADALRVTGQASEAAQVETRLVQDGSVRDPRTVAVFLATRGEDVDTAVDLARRETESRNDVFTLDALGWALAAKGQSSEAMTLAERALGEGTRDARLLTHAAVIAKLAGRPDLATSWGDQAWALRFTLLPTEVELLQRARATTSPSRGE